MIMVASVALIALAGNSPAGPLVYGGPEGWVVLDRQGRELRRIATFGGRTANDVAVSPDGKTFVFTAWAAEVENQLLYAWREGSESSTLLGEPIGWHDQPSFTADGKWVLFVHHPKKGGPPGQHEPGANSQLYRVRSDGSGLEALTDSRGCKITPTGLDSKRVIYVHATCSLGRSLARLGPTSQEQRLSGWEKNFGESSLDASGKKLAVVERRTQGSLVYDADLARGEPLLRLRGEVPMTPDRQRPGWLSDGRIAVQYGGKVWALSRDGAFAELASLETRP